MLACAAAIALQAALLLAMGQPAICTCGTIKLWHGIVDSSENSQHLSDWYTLTHVTHGVIFYFLLWLLFPRTSVAWRLALAVAVEAGWEVFENTSFVIERYRQSALARGYVGDSVVNSVFDTVATAIGFLLTHALPRWAAVVLVLALELLLLVGIRDSLVLNIVQLVHPIEAIDRWQSGR
jgi:hypothetical protein